MTGYGTGECIEENTYRNVEIGSLKGLGTIHFFDREQIFQLWSEAGFKNIKIDYIERSDHNGQEIKSYFFVDAENDIGNK